MQHSNKKEQITDTHKNMDEVYLSDITLNKRSHTQESLKVKYAI